MAAEIGTAIITASGAVLVAGLSYLFTKHRERDTEIRKEKLEHYKEFVIGLNAVISNESNPEGDRAFSRACNKLNLVAPQAVIEALQQFQEEIKHTNANRSQKRHDEVMSRLFHEMRKDLKITPRDSESFKVGLWASGHPAQVPKG